MATAYRNDLGKKRNVASEKKSLGGMVRRGFVFFVVMFQRYYKIRSPGSEGVSAGLRVGGPGVGP